MHRLCHGNGTSILCPDSLVGICHPSYERECFSESECISRGGLCNDREKVVMSRSSEDATPGFCLVPFNEKVFSINPYVSCADEGMSFFYS